ncbi:hypotheical protein [Halarchaeum acidiphilum MH1-52-1]|uniref:Hypotheical protein n=1 Tax=Halarchaeum acidiphilum MH1-52-1 TaxID=1261545 RepID=U2YFW2_9EURY|nr:hypotheical protein [Halarchaeum acidiphilum MH1-52-1]
MLSGDVADLVQRRLHVAGRLGVLHERVRVGVLRDGVARVGGGAADARRGDEQDDGGDPERDRVARRVSALPDAIDPRETDRGGERERRDDVRREPPRHDVRHDRVAEDARRAPVEAELDDVPRPVPPVSLATEPDDREDAGDRRGVREDLREAADERHGRVVGHPLRRPRVGERLPRLDRRGVDDVDERPGAPEHPVHVRDRRVEGDDHDDEEDDGARERAEEREGGTDVGRSDPLADGVGDAPHETALAHRGDEEVSVDDEDARAEPRDGVEQRVLLHRERERERERAGEDVAGPSARVRPRPEPERRHHAGGDEQVVAHEPRVVEERGAGGEQETERDDLVVTEAVPVEVGGEREETAAERGDEAHRDVAGTEDGEDDAVDVREERAVDDRTVLPPPDGHVVEDPVGDAPLVLMSDARAERDESGDEREDRDPEEGGERAAEPAETRVHGRSVGRSS